MTRLRKLEVAWLIFIERPFPEVLENQNFGGVCAVSLGRDVAAAICSLLETGSLSDEEWARLRGRLDDFDVIYDALPLEAQSYFVRLRQLCLSALQLSPIRLEASPRDNSVVVAPLGLPTRMKGNVAYSIDGDGDIVIVLLGATKYLAKAVRLGLRRSPTRFHFVSDEGHVRSVAREATVRDRVSHFVERLLPTRKAPKMPAAEEHFEADGQIPVEAAWLYWLGVGEVRRGRQHENAPYVDAIESVCALSEDIDFGFVGGDGTVWRLRRELY